MDVNTNLTASSEIMLTFGVIDYTLFCGMLGISVLIGIYFGCFAKQDTTDEYLLGGKSMKVIPVAMSLIASQISGITILAVPADVYSYGSNYWWMCLAVPIVCFFTSYILLPVYFKIQVTSIYEYLSMRFDKRVQTFASFLYTLTMFLYLPVVVYIPALAFSQTTGINVHLITPIVCSICVFYTALGGLKGVIWTDAVQFFGIIGSTLAVFFIGLSAAGGFGVVWEKSLRGERLDLFDFNPNPTIRDNFWSVVIGGTFHWFHVFAISQGSVQKFLAVPTLNHARKAILIYVFGMGIVNFLSVFTGDIIYAKYSKCDPLKSNKIARFDQLLPFFVMDVAGKITGLPGIFIAGIFSAALSTLSATLNTVSGTIYEDFLLPFLYKGSDKTKNPSKILKLIVVISGIISICLVFMVEKMGGVLPFVNAMQGISGGPLVGLFMLGIIFPIANSQGAFYGGLIGFAFLGWKEFGSQYYRINGLLKDPTKPTSTDNCSSYINFTLAQDNLPLSQPFVLYRISFWYNSAMGTIIVVCAGLLISWFTKKHQSPVNPDLITPVIHRILRRNNVTIPKREQEYSTISNALKLVTHNDELQIKLNKETIHS